MHLLVKDTLKRVVDQKKQPVSGVTTICLRVDQAVHCGRWKVVSLLFNDHAKLLDIGGNWNTLLCTSIQSIPNMLNG